MTALHDLYALPPTEFTEARTKATAQLKAAGKDREAKELAKAKKPTADAHVLNLLAREAPELLAKLGKASKALATAQKAAVRKAKPDGGALRAAMAEARTVLGELLDKAAELGAAPYSVNTAKIAAALRAALVDPEVAADIAEGHLARAPVLGAAAP